MSIEEYNTKFDYMVSHISNSIYIFEACKMCGYGELIMIDKDDTLSNLYRTVARHFGLLEIQNLFIRNEETQEMKKIPNIHITVREFMLTCFIELRDFVKAIYPDPAQVVYRIIFDDGHTY
jgi:hypothetical protein